MITFLKSIPWAEITYEDALSPLEYCECDNYVLVYPYGNTDAPLEVLETRGEYSIVIDRDNYIINTLDVLYRICEIYFDTECVTNVREYLTTITK